MTSTALYRPNRLVSAFEIGFVSVLLLGACRGFSDPIPQNKQAFIGLWKTKTGYGLDFNTNGTVNLTEDYRLNELKASFFGRDWNSDNVPIEPGPGGSGFFLWKVEFQNDDFLLVYGPNANRRYKINIYPCTETNETKMVLNGMEFVRVPREGLSTPVSSSDPLDLPIKNKVLAARINGINQMTDQNALAKLACKDKESLVRRAACRTLTDPAAITKVACEGKNSDVRWNAINKVTDPSVLTRIALEYTGWDFYLNMAAVEKLTDQAALGKLACEGTNWPGLWVVRNFATTKLKNQEVLAKVACQDSESAIRKAAVRGLTNQDLLLGVVVQATNFDTRKPAFNRLDSAHLIALAAQTKDQAQVLAARVKLGDLDWNRVFSSNAANQSQLGDALGAAALVNSPQPGTNAVVTACHHFLGQTRGARIPELVDLLNRFGDGALAEDYLNSGEPTLQFFGEKWGNEHDYYVSRSLDPTSKRVGLMAIDHSPAPSTPMITNIVNSNKYSMPLLILIAAVCSVLPWAVARFRDPRTRHYPLRKQRCSVLVSLLAAVLPFPVLLFLAAFCLMVFFYFFAPGMARFAPRGVTDQGVFNLCALLVVVPVSFISRAIYRLVRWNVEQSPSQKDPPQAVPVR